MVNRRSCSGHAPIGQLGIKRPARQISKCFSLWHWAPVRYRDQSRPSTWARSSRCCLWIINLYFLIKGCFIWRSRSGDVTRPVRVLMLVGRSIRTYQRLVRVGVTVPRHPLADAPVLYGYRTHPSVSSVGGTPQISPVWWMGPIEGGGWQDHSITGVPQAMNDSDFSRRALFTLFLF